MDGPDLVTKQRAKRWGLWRRETDKAKERQRLKRERELENRKREIRE